MLWSGTHVPCHAAELAVLSAPGVSDEDGVCGWGAGLDGAGDGRAAAGGGRRRERAAAAPPPAAAAAAAADELWRPGPSDGKSEALPVIRGMLPCQGGQCQGHACRIGLASRYVSYPARSWACTCLVPLWLQSWSCSV
jgi:hypothetical protein